MYVEDLHQDSLLYVRRLELGIGLLDWGSKKLICDLSLNESKVNIHKKENETTYNHQFLIDYFKSDTSKERQAFKWEIAVDELVINESQFDFHDYSFENEGYGFDLNHIGIRNLNLIAEDIDWVGDTVSAKIQQLNLIENNGFELKNLTAKSMIADGIIQLNSLTLETKGTGLQGDFLFEAESFSDYQSFYDQVNMQADIQQSTVTVSDVAYFAPPLQGIQKQIYIDGKVEGTVDNLKANQLELQLDLTTRLMGDFSLRDLPDLENTFIFFDLDELLTDAAGIRSIPLPPFSQGRTIELPAYFDELGPIHFNGNFTGYLTDFVAYGRFDTDLGQINTDLLFQEQGDNQFHYSGNVATTGFDMGQFFNVNDLDKASLDIAITGAGTNLKNLDAEAKGQIQSIAYKGFNYENIDLNGTFQNETFIGDIGIANNNLDLIFKGEVNINSKSPVSNFNLTVNKAKLAKLNLFNQKDSTTQISFTSSVNMIGFDIDQFKGIANIEDLKYTDARQEHSVEEIQLRANYEGKVRFIELKSNLLDAILSGNYKLREMEDVYYSFLQHYFPNENYTYKSYSPQNISILATIKNAKPYTDIFIPELSIQPNTIIAANVSSENYLIDLSLTADQIGYKDNLVNKMLVLLKNNADSLDLKFSSREIRFSNGKSMENIALLSHLVDSLNKGKLEWDKYGTTIGNTSIKFDHIIENFHKMQFRLFDSYFNVNDSIWSIADQNSIALDTSILSISNLSIGDGNQNLYLNGTASKSKEDTMNVQLNNIDLNFVSSLLPEGAVELEGTANGTADLLAIYDEISLTTSLNLSDLFINGIDVGNSSVSSVWLPEKEALLIDGNLGEKGSNILDIEGVVYPLKEENSLDLSLTFDHFPLLLVQPYLKGYLSDMEGFLQGELAVSGEGSLPLVRGVLDLDSAGFMFDYLNTHYSIDDQIIIEPDFIGFNFIKVYDSQGNPAIATGTIFHENYTNFNFDVGLEFDKFLALNTSAKDNTLYYGKAITSGIANISGYGSQLIIELDIKSEKGTDFKIPLTEGVDVSNSNFLIFTNSPDFNKEEKEEVDLSGIQMNFDLEITPEADIQIIFDEQVGDLLKAKGSGNLKLEINTIGDFNMLGQYVVEEGDYLFTLKSIVNKRFDLANGSRISWDGDPYQATLDMQAIYNLRAPLIDLFPDDTTSGFKRRIPVELELQLSDYLLNPDIAFDIRLPTADENTKRQLESILYVNSNDVNPQEMNQQVFGLLVLNRFLPSASSSSTTQNQSRGTPGINNGYEFVSNQLSNWFSKVSDQFDVGVKYRPADELNADELDLSLSTEILNDRLVLDGNLGFSGDSPDIETQNSGFIGEFNAEYKISADGRYRITGFNRSVSNSLLQFNSPYTQGFGLFYREEFDKVGELWKKYFGKKKK